MIGTWLALLFPLIVYNLFFGVLDIYGLPSWLRKYKIQPEKNVPVRNEIVSCERLNLNTSIIIMLI